MYQLKICFLEEFGRFFVVKSDKFQALLLGQLSYLRAYRLKAPIKLSNFSSAQDGIYALGKAHMRSVLRRSEIFRGLASVASETSQKEGRQNKSSFGPRQLWTRARTKFVGEKKRKKKEPHGTKAAANESITAPRRRRPIPVQFHKHLHNHTSRLASFSH